MTHQETFDICARHLLSMTERSYETDYESCHYATCMYRGPNGSKCAVGALIPDELYTPVMEGQTAVQCDVARVLEKLGHDVRLCRELQEIHDDQFDDRRGQLRLLATEYRLSTAVLDEV